MIPQGATYTLTRALANSGLFVDFELRISFVVGTTGEQYHVVSFRRGSAWSESSPNLPLNGYCLEIRNNELIWSSLVDGSVDAIFSVSKTWGASLWEMRILVAGDSIKARVWQGTEPGTWDFDLTDATHTSGVISLGSINGADGIAKPVTWDNLVVTASTAFVEIVDATSPISHYRLSQDPGAFADRLFVGVDLTEVGSWTRSTGALVANADGGSSVGGKIGPYFTSEDILLDAVSFTFGAMVMLDKAPANGLKFVLSSSQDADGAYSFEIHDDLSLRIWSRHVTNGYVVKQTELGVVPLGVPVWLAYSRDLTGGDGPGGAGQRCWVISAAGGARKFQGVDDFPQNYDADPVTPWQAVPAGTRTVGAYVNGTELSSWVIAEFMTWHSAKPTADIESIGAKALANVVWLAPTVDLGTVDTDASVFKAIPVASIHPESGLTAVVDTGPTGNVGVTASGQGFNVDGPSSVETATFTAHVTIGAASSAVATFDIETVEGGGGQGPPNPPDPDLSSPVFGRASGTNSPTPDTDDRAYGRAAGTNSPSPDTDDPAFARADQG